MTSETKGVERDSAGSAMIRRRPGLRYSLPVLPGRIVAQQVEPVRGQTLSLLLAPIRPAHFDEILPVVGRRHGHPHHPVDARPRQHSADAPVPERDGRRTETRIGVELEESEPASFVRTGLWSCPILHGAQQWPWAHRLGSWLSGPRRPKRWSALHCCGRWRPSWLRGVCEKE